MLANVSYLTDLQAHKSEQLAVCNIAHVVPFQTDRAKSARVANIVQLAGWLIIVFVLEVIPYSMSTRAWRHVREFQNLGIVARARCCWTTLHLERDD